MEPRKCIPGAGSGGKVLGSRKETRPRSKNCNHHVVFSQEEKSQGEKEKGTPDYLTGTKAQGARALKRKQSRPYWATLSTQLGGRKEEVFKENGSNFRLQDYWGKPRTEKNG